MQRVRLDALALVILVGLACAGCMSPAARTPTVTTGPPALIPAVTATRPLVSTPTPTPPPGDPQRLTVWIIELVAPIEGAGQSILFEQQIAAFQATHPDLTVEVRYKKREGKGGIRDFVTTASAVAPAVVPDLIALDTQTLGVMAREGLLAPLDGLVSPALLSDLYPFAVDACTVDERLVCVQFQASIEHAVYNTSKIAVPPLTWEDIFASGATYIFPTAGQDGLVNDAFLVQYLSLGAELVDANGDPALDRDALVQVLTFYRQGIESGIILTDVLQYEKVEDCWPTYLQAEVVLSNISSNLYLSGRSLLEPVSIVTSIPTRDGQAIALSRGHAWALTTRDPGRWDTAVQLLEWLMYPAHLAAWNQAAGHLPTRRSAFEQMPRDAYVKYMYTLLENTRAFPSSETHQRIYRAMQSAVDDVLRDNVPPEQAAANVLNAVGQEAGP